MKNQVVFILWASGTHFVDAVYVLQLFSEVLGNEWSEADGRDVCDADPEDAPPEVENTEDGKAAAGDDDHDDAGQDAPEEGFPHDVLLFCDVSKAVLGADHHGRDEAGETYADAVTDEGVDRNEGAGKEPPHDGADVAGEEACFHAEDDAHYRRDEGEETEMDHARDDRYWI